MTERSRQQISVSVSRQIAAPAKEIFKVLTDPARHPDIDGTGLLRDGADNSIVSAVGDKFTVRMRSARMGDYEMTSHVVEYERDRRVAWEPVLSGVSRPEHEAAIGDCYGQRWIYELEPIDSRTTVVTETYDCTRSPEWLRTELRNGEHWAESMTKTLENLERQCIGAQQFARAGDPGHDA
jgi:uncharacterized protein YndB with AHSA1/START domain